MVNKMKRKLPLETSQLGDLENQFVSLIWLDVMKKDSIHLICLLVVQLNSMSKN
jgi:hypothetical protein